MTKPVYYICVDWECQDFAGPHDFSQAIDDITAYVKHFSISRGKEKDSNTYPAATLELVIENSSGRFYPNATSGDLVGLVRLWLPVEVKAIFQETTYPLYYGYINRITAYPILDKKNIYFYCTDGIDLLTKTIVVQDMDHKTVMNDGEAVNHVLNAAGWAIPPIACTFQNTGDTVTITGHALITGDRVMFSGSSLPIAVDPNVLYYVRWASVDTFWLTLTSGGDAVIFNGDGSGYCQQLYRRQVDTDGGDITNFPETFEFIKS